MVIVGGGWSDRYRQFCQLLIKKRFKERSRIFGGPGEAARVDEVWCGW